MLANETKRADIQGLSTTTINFAASTALAVRPIRLWASSGRQAALTMLPTALTISGTAGTRYVYASLSAPSGDPYSTSSPGILYRILNALPWNRLDWQNGFRAIHPGDGTLIDPARSSAVTLVETASATPPDTHHVPLGQFEVAGGVITSVTSYEGEVEIQVSAFIHGQCRLTKSGADLKLIPIDGMSLVIDGTARSVPTAGVTLAPSGLTPDTTYFIYAAWSGSAITLEASTTGHTTHTNGVEIKTADSTRTLVGMARIITGPAWVDTAAQRFVLSWFNRRAVHGTNALTANRTTASASFVELNTEIRSQFLTWADEAVVAGSAGSAATASAANFASGLAFDGTTPSAAIVTQHAGNDPGGVGMVVMATLAEGFHYLTLVGATSGGVTGTWHSADTAPNTAKCRTFVTVRG